MKKSQEEMGMIASLVILERQTVTSSSVGWNDTNILWFPNKGSHHSKAIFKKKFINMLVYWFLGLNQNTFRQVIYTGKIRVMEFV